MSRQTSSSQIEHRFELHDMCLCFSIITASSEGLSDAQIQELALAKIKALLQSDEITGFSARKIAESQEIVGAMLYPELTDGDELASSQLEYVDSYEYKADTWKL